MGSACFCNFTVLLPLVLRLGEGASGSAGGGPPGPPGPPECARPGCRAPPPMPVRELLERALVHSRRAHGLSRELSRQLEQMRAHDPSAVRVAGACHTARLATPGSKARAQAVPHTELTVLTVQLLAAWREPLWGMARHLETLGPAWEPLVPRVRHLALHVSRLADGLARVVLRDRTHDSAINPPRPPYEAHGATPAMVLGPYGQDLLFCFMRDMHKVESYLGLVRCSLSALRYCS